MAMVNVNRKVNDQFYRYKMPKLEAKVEGKGNGIKTVIANMVDIAKAIYRPPAYPTKFFGCELGAQTQIDNKNDRYIVNGSHTTDKLQEILDGFIEKFVLCAECKNPETTFNVSVKSQKITSQCTACGHHGNIDMRHRLSTFILKNPPTDDSATPQKLKKVKDSQAKAEEKTDGSSFDGWSDDPLPSKADEEWSEDTSEEAVRQRQEELGDGIKGLTVNTDLSKTVEQRANLFYEYVKKKLGDEKLNDVEILGEANRLDIKDKAPLLLTELLFDENILEQITSRRTLFLRFLLNNPKAQKQLLSGFELIVQNHKAVLMAKVPSILKKFYDCDYLEEEAILEWGNKPSKKQATKDLKLKAKPFIDWLREADEESDDDDEDEEVDVVYTHRSEDQVKKQEAKEKEAAEKLTNGNDDDPDDDLDDDEIDDI